MKLLHFLSLLLALFFAGSAFAAAEFQIVSFDLSENFVSVEAGDSVDVDANVNIRNIGDAAGSATIDLVVKDGAGVQKSTASWSSPLAAGSTANHIFTVNVPDAWGAGLYSFYANVGDGSLPLHAQELKILTLAIIKPPPVPELPLFLVPLAAFSVLAFLFFAGRKQF